LLPDRADGESRRAPHHRIHGGLLPAEGGRGERRARAGGRDHPGGWKLRTGEPEHPEPTPDTRTPTTPCTRKACPFSDGIGAASMTFDTWLRVGLLGWKRRSNHPVLALRGL